MFYAVIPAGGSGTRLWPLSRAERPKFLLALGGHDQSLLQSTANRLDQLCKPEAMIVVTGSRYAADVARQLPSLPSENLLVEPSPKDSGGAIGLAAAILARRDPSAVMGSFAADHIIRDERAFVATMRDAIRGAKQGQLMTVGMRPTRPETGFGYVHCAEELDGGPIRRVKQFKEKPEYDLAVEFVESDDYLWNASMFVWRVDVFLADLARFAPELHAGLTQIGAAWDTSEREIVLSEVWPHLPKIAIEYALMEPAAAAGRVATVPGDFGWSDIGDFRNLRDIHVGDREGNVVVSDDPSAPRLVTDCHDCIVVSKSDRLIAVVGLQEVVIVDTDDVLLVCDVNHAQSVRGVVAELADRGLDRYS